MMRRRIIHHTRKAKGQTVKKRISKMKCQRITRKNSKLPPFKADTCFDTVKKGKDGLYKSTESGNGIYIWKKINAIVK